MKAKFICLCFGIIISLRALAVSGGGFVFLADSVSADQGLQVAVPIRAMHFDSIISIQGTIGFDSARLSYLGIQNMGLPSMSMANFGTSYAANGRITFSWNQPSLVPLSVADSSVLFAVLFQVTGNPGDQVPIPILGTPTLIEVVDWSYTPIAFSTRGGNVSINPLPVCALPDSLAARNILQTQAQLSWVSHNPGAAYSLEWGPWGYTPGNGIGNASGTSVAGQNSVLVSNLTAGSIYEFYVREYCDSLHVVDAGPSGFATLAALPVHPTIVIFGDSIQGNAGDTLTAKVRAIHFTDMISAQGSVQWDPAIASLVSVVNFGLPNMNASNFGLTQVAQGKLSFSWNDASLQGVSLADSAQLFGLNMHLVGAPGTACDLDFPDLPLVWELVDTTFNAVVDTSVPGHIAVLDTLTSRVDAADPIFKIYPNPLPQGRSVLRLSGIELNAPLTQVQIYDMTGRRVEVPVQGLQNGNEIELTLGRPLPVGCWLVQIEMLGGICHAKLLVDGH